MLEPSQPQAYKSKNVMLLRTISLVVWIGLFGFFSVSSVSAATLRADSAGGDCERTIDPIGVWNPDTLTCTLTSDLQEGLQIASNGITLDGAGHAITGQGGSGILVQNLNSVTLKNFSLDQFFTGIEVKNSATTTISSVNVSNAQTGIHLWFSPGSIIEDTTVSNSSFGGIHLEFSDDSRISRSTIANSGTSMFGFGVGFYYGSFRSRVESSEISFSHSGIRIYASSFNTVENTTIRNAVYGVYVSDIGLRADIIKNTFFDNHYHLALIAPSPSIPLASVYQNNFLSFEVKPVTYNQGFVQYSKDLPIGGNYWQNYDSPEEGCVDQNADSLCDSPYQDSAPGVKINDLHPWTKQDAWKEYQLKDPIIIIPGITGSWNWRVLLRDTAGGSWMFPPFSNVYEPLIEKLKEQGYEEGKTLFTAFYDWRQPNVLASQDYLKPIIDQAKQESGSNKVDLIAHSMGGILARSYIQGGHYENDVDQLFMLGTPNQGSSDVYAVWEGGYIPRNWDAVQKNLLKGYLFFRTKIFGDESRYNEIHTSITSVRDLLPTYDYLRDKITEIIKGTGTLEEQNITLNTFNANIGDLNSLVGSVTTIAGDDQSTVAEISVVGREEGESPRWVDGKPNPIDPLRNSQEGDNRVLLSSAHIQSILDQVTLPNTKHGDLPSKSASTVFSRLGLSDPGELALVDQPESILSFWFASPVAPTITDPNGNTISKDASTILGAVYFGEDDLNSMKMVLIPEPLDGEYQIDLVGTAEGYYDFASGFFKEGVSDNLQSFSGEVQVGTEISYTTELSAENLENPVITEVIDTVPPVISIISPTPGAIFEHDQVISLDFLVSDELSSVHATTTLDGMFRSSFTSETKELTTHDTLELPSLSLGIHEFSVQAEDAFGNSTSTTGTFEIIATSQSLLRMVDWGHTHNWFALPKTEQNIRERVIKLIQFLQEHSPLNAQELENAQEKVDIALGALDDIYERGRITLEGHNVLKGDYLYIREHLE